MPNCPECVFKKRNVIIEEHKDDEDVNLNQLLDEVEVLMKFDPVTKHFICKRCGLYATREQVGDIRGINSRRQTVDYQFMRMRGYMYYRTCYSSLSR